MNRLYYGDCFTIMQSFPLASADLIYLDPPFNSNRQYNAIYKDETGRPLPDQIDAFCDMWELDPEREQAIRTMPVLMREHGIDDSIVEFWRLWMNALRGTQPRLLAYLSYMAQRLLIMHRILKPTGSLYFHCDTTASHYVKALLDAIFGHSNFRNEIIWQRRYGAFSTVHKSKKYGVTTDSIFLYARSDLASFNPQYSMEDPQYQDYVNRTFKHVDKDGRRYRIADLANPAPRPNLTYEYKGYSPPTNGWAISKAKMEQWDAEGRLHFPSKQTGRIQRKRFLDELKGKPVQNLWTDIRMIASQSAERMGYATQKPLALMERIIKASSNPGDVVLDPFCGCATTLEAAHKLDRQWIGIDIAIHAVKRVARVRLSERLGLVEGQDFTIEGVPSTLEGAQDLWRRDKYHFQKWAVEQADGFVTARRTGDGGIDGRVYFAIHGERDLQSMVVEVKGGANVSIQDLRALKGVLDNDAALMAGLVIMEPLGGVKERNFNRFMADAGMIDLGGNPYPKMQMLTVEELLAGKRFATPTVAGRHEAQPRIPGLPA